MSSASEPLRTPPQLPYPVQVAVQRVVSAQALVAFGGNFYSIGPGVAGTTVNVRRRLDDQMIEIVTASGVVLARHRREPDGAGVIARQGEHVLGLNRAVLTGCRHTPRLAPTLPRGQHAAQPAASSS